MNKLITNKITLILFFVIICHFTVNAQDSAKKVIVVVRPGGITKTTPASTAISTSTTHPASAASASQPNNKNVAAAPAAQTGAGIQKTGTATTGAVPAAQKTAVAVTQYVAPGSRTHTYNAPSTAERSDVSSYKHAVVPASKQGAPPATATGSPAAATGNASKYAAAAPAPGQAIVTPAVAPAAKKDTVYITKIKKDTVIMPPAKHTGSKIIFAEIGGPGIAISVNYDMRFKKGQKDGFGFRAGVGYFAAGNNTVFTIPVQVNYLYGKDGKYLELGLGTTFINSRGDNYSSPVWEFDTVTGLAATAVIGVRYEPNHAINFRLGYVPIVSSYGLINAGGFSVGYTF